MLTKHDGGWYNKSRSEQVGTNRKAHWKVNNKLWNSFEKIILDELKPKVCVKQIVSEKIIKSQRTKKLILKEKSLK